MHAGGHRFEPVHLHHLVGPKTKVFVLIPFFDNYIARCKGIYRKVSMQGSTRIQFREYIVIKLLRAYGGCLGRERR